MSDVSQVLLETLISPNEADSNLESANVVDGLFAIARGLQAVARAIDRLGNADASTPMGAIEMLGKHIGERMADIAQAIEQSGGDGQ